MLQRTYRHVPLFAARFADGQLRTLLPLMEVASPWTGRRGVSLPFTDFCFPLKAEGQDAGELYTMAMVHGRVRGWRYLECRSSDEDWPGSSPSLVFYGHRLELGEGEEVTASRNWKVPCDAASEKRRRLDCASKLIIP